MSGPLVGVRVLELGGKGPVPFCGMVLSDLGAEVIRVDRPGDNVHQVLNRGRRSIVLDLKSPDGIDAALRIAASCDVVLEGFRPGVIERMGLGPETLLAQNPGLVIGRMTGWGQTGPWSQSPGHDINYIAMSGVLHAIGSAGGPPVVPLNIVGDMGGGGMMLAFGVLAGVLESRSSQKGQVVDAAMVDGSALLMAMMYGFLGENAWTTERGTNRLDGGRPWYRVYGCADGHMAVGCVEAQFWNDFLNLLDLNEDPVFAEQHEPRLWVEQCAELEKLFSSRTRAEWELVFPKGRACVTPVLSMIEAVNAPQNEAREVFASMSTGGSWPEPAPRFSITPTSHPAVAPSVGLHTTEVLTEMGFTAEEIDRLAAGSR